jgi:hypothetical protein
MIAVGVGFLFTGRLLVVIASVGFGVMVLLVPAILNYLLAAYLILLGLFLMLAVGPPGSLMSVVSLIAGVVILIFPFVVNYAVGIYLLAVGLLLLLLVRSGGVT